MDYSSEEDRKNDQGGIKATSKESKLRLNETVESLRMPDEYQRAFRKNSLRMYDIHKNIKSIFEDMDEPFRALPLKKQLEKLKKREEGRK